ncbi:MAG: YheC/YheD family protein [Alicyclobacillus sp.]|nr:YheC/YheD family protein [Alicyclobacillus sp.]
MLVQILVDASLHGREVHVSPSPADGNVPSMIQFADRSLSVRAFADGMAGAGAEPAAARDSDVRTLFISPALRQALGLPSSGYLHVVHQAERWRIGPCLGVYVSDEREPGRRFGEQNQLLADLCRLGAERGIDVVVLTPGFAQRHKGWRLAPGRPTTWVEEWLPLPDVVLRRSGRFRAPESAVAADLRWFEAHGRMHSLPRESSNKWSFYQTARQDAQLREHLPETREVMRGADLWRAVQEWGDVYLKPFNGARGHLIHRLIRRSSDVVEVRSEAATGNGAPRNRRKAVAKGMGPPALTRPQRAVHVIRGELSGVADTDALLRRIRKRFRRWVVQRAIPLLRTVDGRPVDFRWLVQVTGEPQVIGRVGRVGSRDAVTTNLHTGAVPVDACQALNRLAVADPQRLADTIDNLAIRVVRHLLQVYGPFAEVGVDIGVDQAGHPYVFEVNPTPGRRMLRSVSPELRELSLANLVEYAIRAAGFEDAKFG